MARTPRPWYRAERDEWRVTVRGTDHCLGKHPEHVPPPRKQRGKWNAPQPIIDVFLAILTSKGEAPPTVQASPAVVTVLDQFLEWCQAHRSARTYEWSQNHIQSFVRSLTDKRLTVDDLKPFHVQQWADANRIPQAGKRVWGPNHCRGAITAVQRALTWAEQMGHISKSPIRIIEKPAPKRREQVLSPADFTALLAHVPDECFRDVLEFCWETGARVQEVRLVRAEYFKPERSRVEIPPKDAKGKKRWRIIYLTDRAEVIVRRLSLAHPEGAIFRNTDGKQWDAQNFNNRFCRLQHRLGREKLGVVTLDPKEVTALAAKLKRDTPERTIRGETLPKTERELLREARKKLSRKVAKKAGTKYALTAIRHSFCQRLLEAGVDHTTVAALMGHSNAVMVSTTYSHMDQAKGFLRDELKRASSGAAAA